MCHNPPCRNPEHLVQGTDVENAQDRKARREKQTHAVRQNIEAARVIEGIDTAEELDAWDAFWEVYI